jgi:Zn finger protein HypA/HybF involved in hydrogenase expression
MARFLAIGEVPALSEEQFRQHFDTIRKWRPERRTWMVKAYCNLSEGKVVIECETPERESFEAWLSKTGWKVHDIYRIDLIHEAGAIWPM